MAKTTSPDEGRSGVAAPPRENVCRAIRPGYELRDSTDGGLPTLTGHFAVFDQWTEINSMWEGNFLERLSPGAFRKTFKENRDGMRVLFQHGQDPVVGDKPLGPIEDLREDSTGGYYEVPLLDTSYNRDLLPGLEAGLYGASFRFRVVREDMNDEPGISAYNPRGLPERTIREAQVMEFGPVTFPAYAGATAGIRSITDEFVLGRFLRDPSRLRQLVVPRPEGQRADIPSLAALMEMYQCGTEFIALEDDPDDGPDRDAMKNILAEIEKLIAGEANENEAGEDEPGEDAGRSTNAPSESDAATAGTSDRSAAIPSELLWFAKAPGSEKEQ